MASKTSSIKMTAKPISEARKNKEAFGVQETPSRTFDMLKAIKKHPLYGRRGKKSAGALQYLYKHCNYYDMSKVMPGQLCSFIYVTPKLKEELEYYDAQPLVIFFNSFLTKEGERRILGFNLHYFPPQIRYKIMAAIFRMYRPVYMKYFSEGPQKELSAFDYHYIIDNIRKMGMEFAVREYIPSLIVLPRIVPPCYWTTAAFTEGQFHKETRTRILQYWRKFITEHSV